MKNSQRLTVGGGLNKYVYKYIVNIGEQNYVVVSNAVTQNILCLSNQPFYIVQILILLV